VELIDDLLELAKKAGTDKQYQEWCRTQPSAFSGKADWNGAHGEFRCVYAHCRRAGEAGTGYKPPYRGLPLTWDEHQLQHAKGESALVDFDMEEEARSCLIRWINGRLSDY
jgi:hypothetical protein